MPSQRTPNFSSNWSHLKNILGAYTIADHKPDSPSLSDHLHAKAMAVFLTRATLATPFLDRTTVAEVLSGKLRWPSTTSARQFKGGTVPLSFLEANGFVTFYAGWLSVHCRTPDNLKNVHSSVVPLIEAVNHLKDICYGRNNYIQPHYMCTAQDLEDAFSDSLGKVSAPELLPDLRLENGNYHLRPGNDNFSPLVSTYLWFEFNEKDPGQAFKNGPVHNFV